MNIELTTEQANLVWDVLNEKRNEILNNFRVSTEIKNKESDRIAEVMNLLEK